MWPFDVSHSQATKIYSAVWPFDVSCSQATSMHIDQERNSRYTVAICLAGACFQEGKHRSLLFVEQSRYNNEQMATKINQQSTHASVVHAKAYYAV